MTHPELPSLPEFEPTQEELKTLFEGIFGALQDEALMAVRHYKHEDRFGAQKRRVWLEGDDASTILDDENAKGVYVGSTEERFMLGEDIPPASILIDCTIGEKESNNSVVKMYRLFRTNPCFDELGIGEANISYRLAKEAPGIAPDDFNQAEEPSASEPILEFENASELEEQMREEFTKINREDFELLMRIQEILASSR